MAYEYAHKPSSCPHDRISPLKYYYDDLRLHLDKTWLSKWYNAVDGVIKQVDLPSGVKYYAMMYSIKFISN